MWHDNMVTLHVSNFNDNPELISDVFQKFAVAFNPTMKINQIFINIYFFLIKDAILILSGVRRQSEF